MPYPQPASFVEAGAFQPLNRRPLRTGRYQALTTVAM